MRCVENKIAVLSDNSHTSSAECGITLACCNSGDRGFVLICVLWVLAILTIVVFGFQKRSSLDLKSATYSLEHLQAQYAAQGVIELAEASKINRGAISRLKRYSNKNIDFRIDTSYYNVKYPVEFLSSFRFVDETGRFSINDEGWEEKLFKNDPVLKNLVAFRKKEKASQRPRRIFPTRGNMRRETGIYFGDLEARGYSSNTFTDLPVGQNININGAPLEVLQHIPGFSGQAEKIYKKRLKKPFKNIGEFMDFTGIKDTQTINKFFHVSQNTGTYTIESTVSLRDWKVKAICSRTYGNGNLLRRHYGPRE